MAAEDAKRLGGELPNSFSPGKRVMLVRRPRGVVGVISPWNWPYTMPAELIAPALACGNAVVWTPAPSTAVCAVALARVHRRRRPAAGRVQPRHRARARWSATRSRATPGTDGVAFIGSTATGRLVAAGRRRQGGAARDGRQRSAGRDGRRRRRGGRRRDADRVLPVRRPELHRRRADPRPPRGARRVRRAAGAARDRADPARRSVRRRDHDGPGQQRAAWPRRWTSTSATRSTRGAERGQRRRAGDRLPDLAVLGADDARPTCRPTPGSRSRRRSGRSRRWSRSTRSSKRSR